MCDTHVFIWFLNATHLTSKEKFKEIKRFNKIGYYPKLKDSVKHKSHVLNGMGGNHHGPDGLILYIYIYIYIKGQLLNLMNYKMTSIENLIWRKRL